MKKILALLLVMIMLFTLAACNQNPDSGTQGTEEPTGTDGPTSPTGGSEDSTDPPAGGNTSTETTNPPDDNNNNEVADSFVATPVKSAINDFIAKIVAYTQNNNSDESQYIETEKDEESMENENGYYLDNWHIVNFSEDHEFNLFLHATNNLAEQSEEWASIERQNNEYTGDVLYTVKISYDILCETVEEATALARNDAYRLPSFFEITPAEVYFSLVNKTASKTARATTITNGDLEKLANGEYLYISALRTAGNRGGYTCSINVKIQEAADGQIVCHSEFSLKFTG